MAQVKVKRKINKKALIACILTLYLIIMAFYYVWTLPIKNIVVNGNKVISETEIIKKAGIIDYPRMFKYSSKSMKNNILEINGINEVKINKSFLGKVTITVSELDTLFYSALDNTYCLSDGTMVNASESKLGVPVLVNYVPDDIKENLIKKMAKVNINIVYMISEIEYTPNIKNDVTIDAYRFMLRMNDGNHVYINLPNFENINRYEEMYTVLDSNVKGLLKLDVVDSTLKNFSFTPFDILNKENKEEGGSNELPQ